MGTDKIIMCGFCCGRYFVTSTTRDDFGVKLQSGKNYLLFSFPRVSRLSEALSFATHYAMPSELDVKWIREVY